MKLESQSQAKIVKFRKRGINMNILGKYVILRAIEEEIWNIREMINDPEIERMVGGYSSYFQMATKNGLN